MKRFRIFGLVAAAAFALAGLAACGGNPDPNAEGKTAIEFWGWGDAAEIAVFKGLVDAYNASAREVYVNFTKKPSATYDTDTATQMNSRKPPDVVYSADSVVKNWAKNGYIEDLTPYIAASGFDLDDLWDSQLERFQFETDTFRHTSDAPIWGLPKDLGPTAIFYNKDALNAVGVTVVENMPIERVGDEDEKHGYYVKDGQKYFNNSIPMTWEELETLSGLLTKSQNPASPTDYGFYCSWWFMFGWSVGGDVLKFVPSDDPAYKGGWWEFGLNNPAKNYIKDGEFVAAGTPGAVELPSVKEAFEYWISYSAGKGISPKPNEISVKSTLFTDEKTAMLVEGRYLVPELRRDCGFEWDVAPLAKHRDGVEAGHSGGMCLSVPKKSKNKDAAYQFIEYLSGAEGQEALIPSGFNVPNQKSLAGSDKFLIDTEPPYNNEVFVRAAQVQRGGDWTFMPDDAWIEEWAPTLNGDVLNGAKTLDDLYALVPAVNAKLKTYTKK
ncbi:MAG: extracellular solute-binding protein [Clostridiales bacterium]|jgi:multiple sugar transport system substrate-binding protein|nr:extracellular solute-binding protein [Clostridiales bacterium]